MAFFSFRDLLPSNIEKKILIKTEKNKNKKRLKLSETNTILDCTTFFKTRLCQFYISTVSFANQSQGVSCVRFGPRFVFSGVSISAIAVIVVLYSIFCILKKKKIKKSINKSLLLLHHGGFIIYFMYTF